MSSLLPPSASLHERVMEQVIAERLGSIERDIKHFMNPLLCRADLLPWLAWELSVDDWDREWTEDVQRAVVAISIELHTYKGTVYAVRRALESLGYTSVVIIEGRIYKRNGLKARNSEIKHGSGMHWREFDIQLNVGFIPSAEQQSKITAYINNFKPERSQLRTLKYSTKFHNGEHKRDGSINRDGGYVNG